MSNKRTSSENTIIPTSGYKTYERMKRCKIIIYQQ